MVDPSDWSAALENPTLNTKKCCQVCSITEDSARAKKGIGTTGLGQVSVGGSILTSLIVSMPED
jgi:hypothetical protein